MGEIRNAKNIFVRIPEMTDHLEDLEVNNKIIFEWILGKYFGNIWTGFTWPTTETSGGVLHNE
jgi:hypothetical protein